MIVHLQVGSTCVETIKSIFKSDKTGEISLEVSQYPGGIYLFKVNNGNTRTMLFWCLYCWLSTSKYRLVMKFSINTEE